MSEIEKVIIIGSGPAGLTAAIYTARAQLSPLMFEGDMPGGQLTTTTEVENYPGFDKGIQGPELMEIMKGQALRFGTRFISRNVTKVDLKSNPFRVWGGEKEYLANSIIISTGASSKMLGIESEKKYFAKGVSTCATCDGPLFSGKTVAILKQYAVPFNTFNILEDEDIRQGLKEYSNWPTFPQLYVNGELIGGCDIVSELHESGELGKIFGK